MRELVRGQLRGRLTSRPRLMREGVRGQLPHLQAQADEEGHHRLQLPLHVSAHESGVGAEHTAGQVLGGQLGGQLGGS